MLDEQLIGAIPLRGGHEGDGTSAGQLEHRSPVLFDIVRGIVEQWPQPPDPIRGRSLADVLSSTHVQAGRPRSNRSVLRSLIRRVAGAHGVGVIRRLSSGPIEAQTSIPGFNRRSIVLHALGNAPLLHAGHVQWRQKVRSGERVHVYLDVSGSMDHVKGPLYGAVLDCEKFVHPAVHLFSTKIADITLAELRRGVCKSTGGTDIACVADHMETNRVRRALIVTDGWVGKPSGQHRRTLSSAKLAVALLGSTTNTSDLAEVADFTAPLTIGV